MSSSSAAADDADGPPVPTRTQSALTGSLAEKMMKSMGWKEGQGLGKKGEGIVKHVTVERRLEGQGLGLELDGGGNTAFGTTASGFSNALASLSAKYGAPADAASSSDESSDDEEERRRRAAKRSKKFVAPRGHHKKKDLKAVGENDLKAILGQAAAPEKKKKREKKTRAAAEDADDATPPPVVEKKKKNKKKREAADDDDDAAARKKARKAAKKAARKEKS